MIDRLPPHSPEAEQGVLGCCLISPNDCIGEVIEKLKDDGQGGALGSHFYDLRHQTIYEALTEMFNTREAIDIITVQQTLKNKQLLDQIGGIAYLSQLQDAVPSAANLSYYLEIVREKFLLRKMISVCTEVVGRVHDYEGEVDALMDEVERDILRIRPSGNTVSRGIKELVADALSRLESLYQSGGKISGLSTGLIDLDRMTDGMHGGEMIVVAAYPSCGKSALAAGICVHNALTNIPSALLSFEMRPAQLVVRAVCSQSRVNLYDVRDGRVSESQFGSISSASARLAKAPIFIENCNGMSIGQVTAIARRLKQKHGIKLLVIDYIQLVSCPGADSREQEVSQISKGIKTIAMESDIPVIALSQLNDDGKLRESRAIGQDADSVWQIEPPADENDSARVSLIVKKARDGATGKVDLVFLKSITRFEDAARITDDDVPSDR